MRYAVLVLVVAALGCGSHRAAPRLSAGSLSQLVLQPADVGIPQYSAGPTAGLEEPGRARAQGPPSAGGWRALYKVSGTPMHVAVLLADSRADAFRDAGDARTSFRDQRARLQGEIVDVPKLGDEVAAVSQLQQATIPLRYYTFVWRDERVTASLVVTGDARRLSFAHALSLARAQERRIARTVG